MDIQDKAAISRKKIALIVVSGILILVITALAIGFVVSQPAVLLYETFNDPDASLETYLSREDFTLENGRLRVKIESPTTGCSVFVPGTYEDFSLETKVFPVGSLADGSTNIIFRHTQAGWYEVWLRLDSHQVQMIKVFQEADGETRHMFSLTQGWVDFPAHLSRSTANPIRLEAEDNAFRLFLNGQMILTTTDPDGSAFRAGELQIGAGTGQVGGLTMEFDDLKISALQ